ncbi:hypothetical protein A9Q81_23800 [Gammaproteobacteria bacterium 42_54_T18]|nr:hypothetical protein A9Q81_23800 [Gammaproteobacteria bacterium 42_54_T18]
MSDEPIFKSIFGESWDDLPPVMQKHYSNRPFTDDVTVVDGTLDLMCSGPMRIFSPLFWLMKGIPPKNEKDVPVTVNFKSDRSSKSFHFNRIFHFKSRRPYQFRSRMIQTEGNEVIEVMRFGIGWRMSYVWEDERVKLKHKGYVLCVFGIFIPVPLTFLMGEGYAEEVGVDDNTFDMSVSITHALWGKVYGYKGRFDVKSHP